MCITICEIEYSQSLMHETGHCKLVHWENPEGWDGEGCVWAGFRMWTHVHSLLIHVNVCQKPPQYYKVISLQLK